MTYTAPTKIVLVSTLPPVNTSLSEYGKFLVEGLLGASEKVEIHVLADLAETSLPLQEISHPRLSVERCWRLNDLRNPLKLISRLFALKPDLVLFNLQFASFGDRKVPAMLGLTAPMLAKKLGFKVVSLIHNLPDAMELDNPCFGRSQLEQKLIQAGASVATRMLLSSDKLIVTLDRYRQILTDKYKADNVEVIALGSYIEPASQLHLQSANRFLTFGKFGTYKKLEKLLDAFAQLTERHPDSELLIGGTDHPATPGYLASIQQRYAHLNQVKFIGWIEDEALPGLLRDAKALVLSYESTAGSSGPLHLALSQGKPVIAPDMGDFRLVADHEGAELLFYQPEQADGLVNILENVMNNRVDLERISRRNLRVAQAFSSNRIARCYTDLIANLIEQDLVVPASMGSLPALANVSEIVSVSGIDILSRSTEQAA